MKWGNINEAGLRTFVYLLVLFSLILANCSNETRNQEANKDNNKYEESDTVSSKNENSHRIMMTLCSF